MSRADVCFRKTLFIQTDFLELVVATKDAELGNPHPRLLYTYKYICHLSSFCEYLAPSEVTAAARKAKKVKLAKKEGEIFSRIAPWQFDLSGTPRRYDEGLLTVVYGLIGKL